jgi:hypothetical protein
MDVYTIALADIHIGPRHRPVDQRQVTELARSIEAQGLFHPIGVKALDGEERYLLIYGAHRCAAYEMLGQESIPATLLPDEWSEEECLLAELQENSARNDLTGAQRKAYAAEIGRLLSKLEENSNLPHWNSNWLVEIGNRLGMALSTMHNWWKAFCDDTGLSLTPSKALDIHKQQFFDWLEAQQRAAEEDKARKERHAWDAERERECAETRDLLRQLINDYGDAFVWEQVIAAVFPSRCRQEGA